MAHYIIQALLFQLLFLLVYDFLLKKETFFSYNRWYLLLTPVIAMLLPLLKIEILGSMVPAESFIMLPEVYLGGGQSPAEVSVTETASNSTEGFQINWWLMAYGAGALISFILFVKKYRVLKSLFKNRVVTHEKNFRIIEIPNSNLACTFFNTIFLGDQLKEDEIKQILSHELVHVKQQHSADLLFFEIFKILFWFNPLIYIYQSRIATLHEFIADAGVVKTVEKKTYYQQLLNTAFSTENISFINQFFNHSLIKKRIVMLQKSRSKTISKFKYLILVPLMLMMLTYVACSEEPAVPPAEQEATAQEKLEHIKAIVNDGTELSPEDSEEIKEILKTISLEEMKASKGNGREKVQVQRMKDVASGTGDVPFAVIEEVPVFPGCEGLASNDERKSCMSEKLTKFVSEKFDTAAAKPYAKPGINRIYVQFRINKDGSVEELGVRAPSPELEEEARKVINQLPQMTPGKQKGQAVGVLYSLPISFNAGE